MQRCMQKRWKFNGVIMFVSLYGAAVFAMNVPVVPQDSLKVKETITIFDPQQELEHGRSWRQVVPGTIMITPDSKGVVIGDIYEDRGRVRHILFDNDNLNTIVKHPCVRHSPMIAMAHKKDGSLLIISAGNYINSEKKRVAEYVLFCNESIKPQELDFPIQAIALDSYGKTFSIAGQREVMVIDLETGKRAKAPFMFFKYTPRIEDWIVDIAMHSEGNALIAVGSQRGIQWMQVSKDTNNFSVSNSKQLISGKDIIKKIYYPSAQVLLYTTRDGNAKIISVADLLASDSDTIDKITDFSQSFIYDNVVVDSNGYLTTAHWTNDTKMVTKNNLCKIEIYHINKENIEKLMCDGNKNNVEKFILEVPGLDERYDYITELGQCGSGIGHLLNVALHGKYVVALATDGKMRIFSLPIDTTRQDFYEQLVALRSTSPARKVSGSLPKKGEVRSRSNSGGITQSAPDIIVSLHKKDKKSPRVEEIKNDKKGRKNSRDSSGGSSSAEHYESPQHSPHRGNSHVTDSSSVTFASDVQEIKLENK